MKRYKKNPFLSWIAQGYNKDQVWIPWVNIPALEEPQKALEWTIDKPTLNVNIKWEPSQSSYIQPKVFSARPNNPVVDRDKVLAWESTLWKDVTKDEYLDIISKNPKEITPEERKALRRIQGRISLWENPFQDEDASSDPSTPPTADDILKPISEQTDRDIARVEARKKTNLDESEEIAQKEIDRATARIRERWERLKNTLQAWYSSRGFWRSSIASDSIAEQQKQIDDMIDTAEKKYRLEQAIRDAQIEGLSGEETQGLRSGLEREKEKLSRLLQESIERQQELDAEMNKSFSERIDSLFATIQASGDDLPEYDDKASKALWYISDKYWNPLKLDENGNPIAPKNDFGQDVKITTFKDSNGNTYIYENWFKSSVITNQWEIKEWTDDIVVPKQVKDEQTESKRRDLETQLRKEYAKRPEVSRFQDIRGNFTRIQKARNINTWAWDVAMVFSFMKMLDPWSVVRESEYATAENTWGVDDKVRNTYNKLLNWERLTPEQRNNFYNLAKSLFDVEVENVKQITANYKKIIEEAGWRPDYIFVWWEMNLWVDNAGDIQRDWQDLINSPLLDKEDEEFFWNTNTESDNTPLELDQEDQEFFNNL